MEKIIPALIAIVWILIGCTPDKEPLLHMPADLLAEAYEQDVDVDCGPGSTIKPHNLSPSNESNYIFPNINLTWDFSGCDVWQFTIDLVKDKPDFGQGSAIQLDFIETARSYLMDPYFVFDCTTYYWRVTGHGSSLYVSDIASFKTNLWAQCPALAECTDGPPMPVAITPSSSMLHSTNPQLLWIDSEPSCTVENYHYEVSRTADFNELVLEGDTTAHSVSPAEPFLVDDCTDYFWRVTAEANGISKTSNVLQIGTLFTGTCQHEFCEVSELTSPMLILPASDAIVTTQHPQFLWSNNLEICHPHSFAIQYSTDPTMSTVTTHTQGGWQLSWTPDSDNLFQNCSQYYWQVVAWPLMGGGSAASEIGTFFTDFGNTICSPDLLQPIAVELLKSFGLGCVNSSQMWAIFQFSGPVVGEFEVHAGTKIWPCALMEGTNDELLCYGSLIPQQVETAIQLYRVGGDQPFLTQTAETPQCTNAVICQPPAEGCLPIRNSRTGEVLANTHWDAGQCACVP